MNPFFTHEVPGQFPVEVYLIRGTYVVKYGHDRREFKRDTDAFREAGVCILHAMHCAGLIPGV